jgi:hypothetical protein
MGGASAASSGIDHAPAAAAVARHAPRVEPFDGAPFDFAQGRQGRPFDAAQDRRGPPEISSRRRGGLLQGGLPRPPQVWCVRSDCRVAEASQSPAERGSRFPAHPESPAPGNCRNRGRSEATPSSTDRIGATMSVDPLVSIAPVASRFARAHPCFRWGCLGCPGRGRRCSRTRA